MEQSRNVLLENMCEALSESRAITNAERVNERGYMQGALVEMHRKGYGSFQWAGVELLRVPGEEKLRVRTTNVAATSSSAAAASDAVVNVLDSDDDDDEGAE